MNRRTWPTSCPRLPSSATFRGGFLVGISNPKLLIFAAAFFPQFITPSAPWLPQFALLVATFVAVELTFYVVYALSGRRLAAHLVRGVWRRRLNRASGVIFAGFGLRLAALSAVAAAIPHFDLTSSRLNS